LAIVRVSHDAPKMSAFWTPIRPGSEVAEQQTTTAEAAAGGNDLVVLRRELLQLPKAVAVSAAA
jgi:hypothetical protein